jgi:hypothetical protein
MKQVKNLVYSSLIKISIIIEIHALTGIRQLAGSPNSTDLPHHSGFDSASDSPVPDLSDHGKPRKMPGLDCVEKYL